MIRSLTKAQPWAAALATLAIVSGCGGGGGGATTDGAGPPPVADTSGLLTSPPAVGITLQADAAVLRPLRDGSVLRYRGRHVSEGVAPTVYENVVRHIADGAGIREAQSNAFDGGEDPGAPVVVSGGQVSQRQTLLLVEGQPELEFEFVELRSPVREGDRYVTLDRRMAAGVDLDGDGVQDSIAVAVWTDVIGADTVTLGTGRMLQTIRTATRARLRAHYSADNSVSDVVEIAAETWYAPGIGIVKMLGDTDDGRDVVEETLVDWDGIDQGLGATTALVPLAPAGGLHAGQPMPVPTQAVGFDSHAVVLASLPGEPEIGAGFSLTQLDDRGRIVSVASYRYADLLGPGGTAGSPKLLRWGDAELRVVLHNDDGLHLVRLDGTGQQLLAQRATVLLAERPQIANDPRGYQSAADGSTLWVSWLDEPVVDGETISSTLWLQGFDGAAQVATPRVALARGVHPSSLSQIRLAAASGRVLATWSEGSDAARQSRYAVMGAASAAAPILGSLPAAGAGAASVAAADLSPWFLPGVPAAVTFIDRALSATATLDTTFMPVLNGADLRLDPMLPAGWTATNQQGSHVFATPEGLGLVEPRFEAMWPDQSVETSFMQFNDLPWSDGAPNRDAARILARVPGLGLTIVAALPMGNRLLVVGADCYCANGILSTMLVWR